MAPIHSTSVTVTRQVVDDEKLRMLRKSLEELKINVPLSRPDIESSEQALLMTRPPLDIEQLVALLKPWISWSFEEQVSRKLK
jgi:hypothetical protein